MFLNANVRIGEFRRDRSKKSTIAPNYHANSLKYKHICHPIFQQNHLNFGVRFLHLKLYRFFSNPRKLLLNPCNSRVSLSFESDGLRIFGGQIADNKP